MWNLSNVIPMLVTILLTAIRAKGGNEINGL